MPGMTAPRRRWARRIVRGLLALAGLAVAAEAARVFAGSNRHTVIPGRVYRCAQPSADGLRQQIEADGIRTVINLRGPSLAPPADWYADELAVTHALGVSQEDFTLSAYLPPPPAEVRRLVEVLDRTEYPVLVHCKQGADRTGLVSAVALLLYTDAGVSEARRQLLPWKGHFPLGKTAAMGRVLTRYENWLAEHGEGHRPDRFRHWLLHVYTPEVAASELTWLDPPATLPAGRSAVVTLRACNQSAEPWEFKPGDLAGIHVLYTVSGPGGGQIVRERAGLVRRTVSPGESIDLALVVPPLPAGRYVLTAELLDARGAGVPVRASSFVKMGDEAAQLVLDVR